VNWKFYDMGQLRLQKDNNISMLTTGSCLEFLEHKIAVCTVCQSMLC